MRKRLPPMGLTASGRVAFALLWLFVCSFPVEKTIEIPGVGYLSKALGMLALGAGVLAVTIDGRMRSLTRTHGVLALFVLWTAVTLRWSLDAEATVSKAGTLLQLLGMGWLIWEFCVDERRVVSLMQAYIFGTFYAGANALLRYQLAHQTYYLRYAADGFDPNDFALTLALSIPMSYCLAIRAKGAKSWIYWAQLALTTFSILLSASRTGFLATCVAACIVPLTFAWTRRKQKILIVTGAIATVLCLAAVVPASSWQRLGTIGSEVRSGSLNDRGSIWSAGLQVFEQHWLAGVGSGAYPRSVEPVLGWPARWLIVAHNTFLSVLVETGIIGFAMFAVFLALLARAVLGMQGLSRILWAITLMVWFAGVNTLTWEVRKPTWLIFGLILAHARFSRRVPAAAVEPLEIRPVAQWTGVEARA